MLVRRVTKKGQVTKRFTDLVNEFVERYRPALEVLAKAVIYFTTEQVLFIHHRMIEETGGQDGMRVLALLESALARPTSGRKTPLILPLTASPSRPRSSARSHR